MADSNHRSSQESDGKLHAGLWFYSPGGNLSVRDAEGRGHVCNFSIKASRMFHSGAVEHLTGVVQSADAGEKPPARPRANFPILSALLIVKLLFVLMMSVCCGTLFSLLVALILARNLATVQLLISGSLAALVLLVCLWSAHKFFASAREALSEEREKHNASTKPSLVEA